MYLKPDSKWSPSGPEVVPVHSTNAMLPNSRMKKVETLQCTGCLNEALPIVGKMWRRSDTSVLFFRLSVFYFASGHASTVFLHFVVKIDIRWRNRHPLSLSVGKTCFLMTFHVILRQISNYCLCAVPLGEFSVCAIFSHLFQLWAHLKAASSNIGAASNWWLLTPGTKS